MKNIFKINILITALTLLGTITAYAQDSPGTPFEESISTRFFLNSRRLDWRSSFIAQGINESENARFFFSTQNGSNGPTRCGIGIENNNDNTRGGTPYLEALTILPNGNVGIGNREPAYRLDVVGNSYMGGQMGIGRSFMDKVQLAVSGSVNISDKDLETVFHVSTGIKKVFVGTEAYKKYKDAGGDGSDGSIKKEDYSLWVSQGVNATDFAMSDLTTWNDFVFAKDYKLPTLSETELFIAKNKHLPYIPSEADVLKNGYSVHNMNRGFLQTIEEITLHSIAQEKEINLLKSELAEIKAMLLLKK